jgi:hypothetical protein
MLLLRNVERAIVMLRMETADREALSRNAKEMETGTRRRIETDEELNIIVIK